MTNLINELVTLAGKAGWLNNYYVLFVSNPKSGGFTNAKAYRKHLAAIKQFTASFTGDGTVNNIITTMQNSNFGDFKEFIPKLATLSDGKLLFIVSLGGDGLASEIVSSLANSDNALQQRSLVLKAPMGTGNDGSSCKTMYEVCQLIAYGPESGRQELAKIINIDVPGLGRLYATNTVCLGIDAFIAYITDIAKSKMAANLYKPMITVAALFYNCFYSIGKSHIKATLTNNQPHEFNKKLMLFCVGYQGGAKYGGGQTVIPNTENVCALAYLSILKRIIYKNRIASGDHRSLKETDLFTSNQLTYNYDRKILLNTDGEAYKLNQQNFPLTINITTSQTKVLKTKL
ncbi:MAG: hypothetical protein FWE37_03745 [Spirochaetaceae bacterium]|nr:hypothetical protein [Spirochaetaceae bacterium]